MTCADLPVPSEAEEQMAVFTWAAMERARLPELALLYHVPNGGSRHPVEAARMKAQGVKPGVPDLCLPAARHGCHGLYIEMKRKKGGVVSPEQREWLAALTAQGYRAIVCRGAEAAIDAIKEYLEG